MRQETQGKRFTIELKGNLWVLEEIKKRYGLTSDNQAFSKLVQLGVENIGEQLDEEGN